MTAPRIVRWRDWSGAGIEHLVLTTGEHGITADSAVVGTIEGVPFAARYRIGCDPDWRVRSVMAEVVGGPKVRLAGDGAGNWTDEAGRSRPALAGAVDVDLSVTPFTNTLPIRRLGLGAGQSAEILVVYLDFPDMRAGIDRQRYTCLAPMRRYLFEAVDGTFTREIRVGDDGLVLTYPGLFRRER